MSHLVDAGFAKATKKKITSYRETPRQATLIDAELERRDNEKKKSNPQGKVIIKEKRANVINDALNFYLPNAPLFKSMEHTVELSQEMKRKLDDLKFKMDFSFEQMRVVSQLVDAVSKLTEEVKSLKEQK